MQHLYPTFLTDPQQYKLAEQFWRDLWSGVMGDAGVVADWRSPTGEPRFGDGTPIRDGNPIFSVVTCDGKQGLRIIHHAPAANESGLE